MIENGPVGTGVETVDTLYREGQRQCLETGRQIAEGERQLQYSSRRKTFDRGGRQLSIEEGERDIGKKESPLVGEGDSFREPKGRERNPLPCSRHLGQVV